MRGPILRLTTSALILNVVLFPSILSVQARSPPRDVHPDGGVHTAAVRAGVAGPGYNGTLPVEPDRVLLRVDVYGNGTADWRIEYWIRLENRTAPLRFERFNRSLDGETTATSDGFYGRVERSVEAAEDATGREMSAAGFDTHTTIRQIPKKYGVVVYSFRWRGFANASDGRLRVGDALQGLYLGSGEHLSVSWPGEYVLADGDPEPDAKKDNTVVWHGPTVFGLEGPRLLFVERSESRSGILPLGTAIVVAIVAVLWWVRRSGDAPLTPPKLRTFGNDGDESELLSNEEQVIRFLEEHDGRVRQGKVADELGWTPSKTSYVVTSLRDDGEIYTFRLGNENVLSLSDSPTTRRPKT